MKRGVNDAVVRVRLSARRRSPAEPNSGRLLLLAHAAVDDDFDAVDDIAGDAEREIDALLVGVVERRRGAAPVGDELVDADGRSPAARPAGRDAGRRRKC